MKRNLPLSLKNPCWAGAMYSGFAFAVHAADLSSIPSMPMSPEHHQMWVLPLKIKIAIKLFQSALVRF